jgi:hypothetical protein
MFFTFAAQSNIKSCYYPLYTKMLMLFAPQSVFHKLRRAESASPSMCYIFSDPGVFPNTPDASVIVKAWNAKTACSQMARNQLCSYLSSKVRRFLWKQELLLDRYNH